MDAHIGAILSATAVNTYVAASKTVNACDASYTHFRLVA
jgi:hypothetical protein